MSEADGPAVDVNDQDSAPPPAGGVTCSLLQNLIFLNWVQFPPLPRMPDLSDPAKFLDCDTCSACHLYISVTGEETAHTHRVGAWYMLPAQSSGRVETLASSDTVILYLHGNSYNRSQPHRVGLYKKLLALGYYVLAVDYRGYGDSTVISPVTEASCVTDARAALAWLTAKLGDQVKVVVWGHSLGTAIASHMVADFDLETGGGSSVAGLVLEAPFNCMRDEVMTFKAARALTWLMDIEQTLETAGVMFETNKWLPAVKAPVLLLSAEDDAIVPHSLAVSLHQETKEAGKENIRFVILPASLGLGHNDIYNWDSLDEEITNFVTEVAKNTE